MPSEMQLNIYKVSHPIIKIMLTYIEKNSINREVYQHYYKYIGLLLTYEMLRKHIKTTEIYIKLLEKVKEFSMTSNQERHVILTNINNTYNMLADIEVIFPRLIILHINYKNTLTIEESIKDLKIDLKNANIFVLEKFTENEEIINLLRYLKKIKHVPSDRISIGCMKIHHHILQKIGNDYPKLKMYTVKINN